MLSPENMTEALVPAAGMPDELFAGIASAKSPISEAVVIAIGVSVAVSMTNSGAQTMMLAVQLRLLAEPPVICDAIRSFADPPEPWLKIFSTRQVTP